MLEAGAAAPDFALPDQDGNEVSLADQQCWRDKVGGLENRRQAAAISTGQAPERTRS